MSEQQERFKLVVFAGLFLRKDDKVLLQKRCNNEYCSQLYSCPGGSIDGEESVKEAAVREAREELGICIKPEDLRIAHVIHFKSSHGEFVQFCIEAHRWDGEPRVMEPNKCSGIKWFSVDALPENITAENKQVIKCIQKGVFYSERGFD